MSGSREIAEVDLKSGGFDAVADAWALDRGISDIQGGKANAVAIGIESSDLDMGTSPGNLLSDNATAKVWFQELEEAVDEINQNITDGIPAITTAVESVQTIQTEIAGTKADIDVIAINVSDDKDEVLTAKALVDTAVTNVTTLRNEAQSAATASQSFAAMNGPFWPNARNGVPVGAVLGNATVSTGGTGGTDGIYNLIFVAGNFTVNPIGTFTVLGGQVTNINISSPGNCTQASVVKPTLSFTNCPGLSGATGTYDTTFLVLAGNIYYTNHLTKTNVCSQFRNNGGNPELLIDEVGWLNFYELAAIRDQIVANASKVAFGALVNSMVIGNRSTYVSVAPGISWNGVAGSGFVTPPADPVRTTAKPACRLIVPPIQVYTDYIVVGVAAAANNNDNLTNHGLEKVEVYFEGNVVEIKEPSYYSYLDTNGVRRTEFGWWCVLLHNGINMNNSPTGGANVYFKAIPKDTTMQSRVIGPYTFFPRSTLYDIEITIEPSMPISVGSRYQNIIAALDYCRTNTKYFPKIELREVGVYDLTGTVTYQNLGYAVIQASLPATIGKTSYTTDTNLNMRSRFEPLCFRGKNLTIDYAYIDNIYHESTSNKRHWFDGCKMTNSLGRNRMIRKGPYITGNRVRNGAWFTEVEVSEIADPFISAQLVRGCTVKNALRDIVSDALCVTSLSVNGVDNTEFWAKDVDAMTVIYTGTEITATLSLTGENDAATRTFTATWGTNSSTFSVGSTEALYVAGTNYDVADVVAWLNTLPGWTATLIDDTRRASALSLRDLKGAPFPETNVKNASLILVTMFDIQSDWYQQNSSSQSTENVVLVNNIGYDLVGQNLVFTGTTGVKDFFIANNVFHNRVLTVGYGAYTNNVSQFNYNHSHVTMVHNTFVTQDLTLRSDLSYIPDAYSLVANNSVRRIAWNGAVNVNLAVRNNHVWDVLGSSPSGAVNTSVGGDYTSLYVSVTGRDFSPNGELLDNLRPPLLRYNAQSFQRANVDCVGGI